MHVTEAEWLAATESVPMLAYLRAIGRATQHKLRLYNVAAFQEGWPVYKAALEHTSDRATAVGGRLVTYWPPAFPDQTALHASRQVRASVLRDVFGNPFRPPRPVDPAWLTFNGGAARSLAQSVHDSGRLDRLPLLADALEDAGCADADLLGHLRSPGPHVRGCWAVDLVLGKS
jgi:hypothetical protein